MDKWTWAAARCRGTSHQMTGSRCQDAFSCQALSGGQLLVVLSDGAGSAALGGEGAALATRTFSTRARLFCRSEGSAPSDDVIHGWVDEVRNCIAAAAKRRELRPRDFAATLIGVIVDSVSATVVHIGDGCAVGRTSSQEWMPLTWPAHGEYASTTYFVTDDPRPATVIRRYSAGFSTVVVFTDGLERLALNFSTQLPHAKFFEGVAAPVTASRTVGRDPHLSKQLALYLDSAAVNARTDDDKTLVIAVQR